ncbi:MAG: protein kinase [Rhodothermales bacterium]|nr:protein kinase [Rhodothermales bacterium]
MNTPDWTRLEFVFEKALTLKGEERVRYLDTMCAGDTALRAELEGMLTAYEAAPGFFSGMRQHVPGQGAPSGPRRGYVQAGDRINQYVIERELGAGGMGVVYLARDTRLDRLVALKFLPMIRRGDEELSRRFLQEARAASQLDHPNICTIYEFNESAEGEHFIAMAYYDGETLKAKQVRTVAYEQALEMALQMLRGLAHAHEKGIVHRDIKPDNLLVTAGGVVKVLDFGLAKMQGVDLTRTGMTMGTVAYMCPEQARGGVVDARSDIWSAGVVLYELLTGERPFRGDYDQAVIYSILNEDPAPPSSHQPELSPTLDAIVLRCLAKDPDQRYPRAAEVLEAIVALDQTGTPAPPLDAAIPVMRSWLSYRRYILGALVVAVAALGGWWMMKGERVLSETGTTRLAVLPFVNMGADSALVNGLEFTVTSKLTLMQRFDGTLSVVPSGDLLADGVVSAEAAAERLDATLALGASVRQRGAGLLLTLQLIDAPANRVLDSRVLEVSNAEMGQLDDRIVESLAGLLDVQLNDETQAFLSTGASRNAQAYNDYTRARGYLQRYEDASNIDASIGLFKLAVKEDTTFTLAYAGLGEANILKYELDNRRQWLDEAIQYGRRAIELDEELGPVRLTMGMIYLKTGDYPEAERQFLRAFVLDDTNAEAPYQLARVYDLMGEPAKAEEFFLRAIRLAPDQWLYANGLGNFYNWQGRHEEAIPLYQTVIRLRPKNPWGYNNLGVQYQALERIDDALESYRQAARANPAAAEPTALALYNIGTIHYLRDDFAEARRQFRGSVDLLDTDLDVWQDLGSAYHWLGRADSARVAWERVVDLAGKRLDVNAVDHWALWNQSFALARLGQRAQAFDALNRFLALEGATPTTWLNAAKCYEALGDRDRAIDFIRQALEAGLAPKRIEASPWLDDLRRDPRYTALAGAY